MNNLPERLGQQACFRGLESSQLDKLAACAEHMHWQPDQYLFQQGGPAEAFYLLESGQAALEVFTRHCTRMRIQTLGTGELLGWSWLYPPYRWHFDALALTRVEALQFDARKVRQLMTSDHELGYQLQLRFMPLIIKRLQSTRMQMAELYGNRTDSDADL